MLVLRCLFWQRDLGVEVCSIADYQFSNLNGVSHLPTYLHQNCTGVHYFIWNVPLAPWLFNHKALEFFTDPIFFKSLGGALEPKVFVTNLSRSLWSALTAHVFFRPMSKLVSSIPNGWYKVLLRQDSWLLQPTRRPIGKPEHRSKRVSPPSRFSSCTWWFG